MPTPEWLAKAKAALARGDGSPELRAELEQRIRAFESGQVGDAGAPDAGIQDPLGPGGMSGGGGAPGGAGGGVTVPDPMDGPDFKPPAPVAAEAAPEGLPMEADLEVANWLDRNASALGGGARSLLHGLDSSITGGIGTRLGEAVDPGTQQRMETARAEHPIPGAVGAAIGAFAPSSLAGLIGKSSAGAVGLKAGQGALETVARGGLAGLGAASAQSGLESLIRGDSLEQAGENATRAVPYGFGFGALASAIGKGATAIRDKLRDPASQSGRDLVAAEGAGAETSAVRGLKPGGVYDALDEAARAEGSFTSPAALAAEEASEQLGKTVQSKMDSTLGKIGAQNAAGYEQGGEASMLPLMRRQLDQIAKATRDGKPLPGSSLGNVVAELKNTASRIRLVSRNSQAAHNADPQDTMDVGLAKHLGLIKGKARPEDAERLVLFSARSADRQAVDEMVGGFSEAAKEAQAQFSRAAKPNKAMAGAAREVRNQFGDEWAQTKAEQSEALGEMKNAQQAAGLSRSAEGVRLDDLRDTKALYNAVLGYRSGEASLPTDRVLDSLAKSDPALRQLLDEYAGVMGIQRLRNSGDPTTTWNVMSPFRQTNQLRTDAIMRHLQQLPMLSAPVGAEAARR